MFGNDDTIVDELYGKVGKIKELIQHHKNSKQEVEMLLEELSQIDTSKLDYLEEDALKETKMKYTDELYFRQLFIQDLEELL